MGDSRVVVGTSGIVFDRDCNYYDVANTKITISGSPSVTGSCSAIQVINDENQDVSNVISITGGTFSSDVSEYVDSDQNIDQTDGKYTVTTYYAQVGETKYTTLADAVAAANGAETPVVLINDVDQAAAGALVIAKGKDIVLDLNGHSMRCANHHDKNIKVQGKLTLKDSNENGTGRIYSDAESYYVGGVYDKTLIDITNGGEFVMESGLVDCALDNATGNGQFGVGVWGGCKVTINGGTIKAGWYAVAGNGGTGEGGTTITVNGGELISTADYAVYHPQTGTLTVNNGTIYGEAGAVAMKRGDLTINGGTLTSKGKGNTGTWGDGTGNLNNAALNFSKPYGDVSATIKDGTITAEGNALVVDAQPAADKKVDIAISGGTYSSDVSAYCVDGFMAQKNEEGTYGITEAQDAFLVYQDKNDYITTGNDVTIDWLNLKKMVVANDVDKVSVSLNRNFTNTGWNSFYVPFDITLTEDMLNTFEFFVW